MRATLLLFFLLALIKFSYQQDAVGLNTCSSTNIAHNQQCLSSTFAYSVDSYDLSRLTFCADAVTLTQCIDASCLQQNVIDVLQVVIPQVFRPNICPICSDIPFIFETTRKVCTAFGLNHVIPFSRNSAYSCPATNSTILLATNFLTLTAITDTAKDPYDTSTQVIWPGITAVRFDYHGCAVFSRTWQGKEDWSSDSIPTAGWFPHTIRITQNSTQVAIKLPALNTDIFITKNGRYLAVSVGYGVRSSTFDMGVCVDTMTCTRSDVLGWPAPTTPPCTNTPALFGSGRAPILQIRLRSLALTRFRRLSV